MTVLRIILLASLVLIKNVEAGNVPDKIHCWVCNSLLTGNMSMGCEDPYDGRPSSANPPLSLKTRLFEVCGKGHAAAKSLMVPMEFDTIFPAYCVKIVGKETKTGKSMIARGCYYNNKDLGFKAMYSTNIVYGDSKVSGYMYLCDTFYCNDVLLPMPGLFILALSLICSSLFR